VNFNLIINNNSTVIKLGTCVIGKAIPLQAWTVGLQEFEALRFLDNRHMKVVRLSALRTGRLCPPGNIPGNHFC
jgi:hypothetical protein